MNRLGGSISDGFKFKILRSFGSHFMIKAIFKLHSLGTLVFRIESLFLIERGSALGDVLLEL